MQPRGEEPGQDEGPGRLCAVHTERRGDGDHGSSCRDQHGDGSGHDPETSSVQQVAQRRARGQPDGIHEDGQAEDDDELREHRPGDRSGDGDAREDDRREAEGRPTDPDASEQRPEGCHQEQRQDWLVGQQFSDEVHPAPRDGCTECARRAASGRR